MLSAFWGPISGTPGGSKSGPSKSWRCVGVMVGSERRGLCCEKRARKRDRKTAPKLAPEMYAHTGISDTSDLGFGPFVRTDVCLRRHSQLGVGGTITKCWRSTKQFCELTWTNLRYACIKATEKGPLSWTGNAIGRTQSNVSRERNGGAV